MVKSKAAFLKQNPRFFSKFILTLSKTNLI